MGCKSAIQVDVVPAGNPHTKTEKKGEKAISDDGWSQNGVNYRQHLVKWLDNSWELGKRPGCQCDFPSWKTT